MKSHVILSVLLFSWLFHSCSQLSVAPSQRTPASKGGACQEYMMNIFQKSRPKLGSVRENELNRKGLKFWKNHYRKHLLNPLGWGAKFKRIVTRNLQNLNHNKIPVYYLMDQEETMAKILKAVEAFKVKSGGGIPEGIGGEAISEVQTWLKRYSSYGDRMNSMLQEYLSLDMSISQLGKAKGKVSDYPHIEEIVLLKNGKKEVKVFEFMNPEELQGQIIAFKDEKSKFLNGWIRKKGSIVDIQLKQAEDLQRLSFLFSRLRNLQLTNEKNGLDNPPELLKMIDALRKVIKDDKLKPSSKYRAKVISKELRAEIADLRNTVSEHEAYIAGKKFLESLSDEERELLGIKWHGRAGDMAQMMKDHPPIKYFLLLSGLSGSGYGLYEMALFGKEIWIGDKARMMTCAMMEDDDAYWNCAKEYFEKEFKMRYPLAYIARGHIGLNEALDGDEDTKDEFKEKWQTFVTLRAEYMAKKQLEEQGRREHDELIEELMRGELEKMGVTLDLDGVPLINDNNEPIIDRLNEEDDKEIEEDLEEIPEFDPSEFE